MGAPAGLNSFISFWREIDEVWTLVAAGGAGCKSFYGDGPAVI